jgi:ribosome-binding protein aMBF1 (putative translation factor)
MKNCSKCGKSTSNTTIVPHHGSITHLCNDCIEQLHNEQEAAMLTAVNHSIVADCVQY